MKTTLRLPTALHRKAKARAAMEGRSLEELLAEALEARLAWVKITPETVIKNRRVRRPAGHYVSDVEAGEVFMTGTMSNRERDELNDGRWEVQT